MSHVQRPTPPLLSALARHSPGVTTTTTTTTLILPTYTPNPSFLVFIAGDSPSAAPLILRSPVTTTLTPTTTKQIPEGLVTAIPEMEVLIEEIDALYVEHAGPKSVTLSREQVQERLTVWSKALLASLPAFIQEEVRGSCGVLSTWQFEVGRKSYVPVW